MIFKINQVFRGINLPILPDPEIIIPRKIMGRINKHPVKINRKNKTRLRQIMIFTSIFIKG